MKIVQALFALLVVGLMVLAGCSTGSSVDSIKDTTTDDTGDLQAVQQGATGDAEIDDVGSDIVEIDGLDEDLDSADLDALDAELTDLDW